MLDHARASLDLDERTKLYAEIQDILADSAAWIPIYNEKEIAVMGKHVKGFEPSPIEYNLTLSTVWIEK